MKKVNLINKKFNRWVVTSESQPRVRFSGNKKYTDRYFICECECGSTQEISYCNLKQGRSKSCGCLKSELARESMNKFRPTQFGENNPNWQGGITSENRKKINKERNTKESRLWTKLIKERDGECKKCGTTEFLQSHHIDSWIDNPDKRFELDNGVCLCKSCHHEFHKEFGFGNNNLEQLDIFLN